MFKVAGLPTTGPHARHLPSDALPLQMATVYPFELGAGKLNGWELYPERNYYRGEMLCGAIISHGWANTDCLSRLTGYLWSCQDRERMGKDYCFLVAILLPIWVRVGMGCLLVVWRQGKEDSRSLGERILESSTSWKPMCYTGAVMVMSIVTSEFTYRYVNFERKPRISALTDEQPTPSVCGIST